MNDLGNQSPLIDLETVRICLTVDSILEAIYVLLARVSSISAIQSVPWTSEANFSNDSVSKRAHLRVFVVRQLAI